MRTGDLQAKLTATNSWWRSPQDWTRRDPDLQEASAAPFTHTAGVLDDLARGGLYVLRGPRRVGKSVELKHTIERLVREGADPRAIMHMSVDGWSAADLAALVRAAERLMPPDGHRWWLIDEITAIADGWPAQIKWLRTITSDSGRTRWSSPARRRRTCGTPSEIWPGGADRPSTPTG